MLPVSYHQLVAYGIPFWFVRSRKSINLWSVTMLRPAQTRRLYDQVISFAALLVIYEMHLCMEDVLKSQASSDSDGYMQLLPRYATILAASECEAAPSLLSTKFHDYDRMIKT